MKPSLRALSPLTVAGGVFLLALVVRLVFVCAFNRPGDYVRSDMWVYDHRARNLLSGDLSAWDTFTPVGYPAFVAAVYALSGKSALLVGVVQAFLGALTAALTTLLAERAFGRRELALVLGVLCALHVPGVFYTGFLLTETTFSFLVVSAAAALVYGVDRGSRWAYALTGLLLGAGATVRPNLLLFLPCVPLILLLASGGRWRGVLVPLALVFGALLVPTGVAATHNSLLLGRPAALGTNGGLNFYLNLAEVRGVRFSDRRGTHRITPLPNLSRYPNEEEVYVPFYDEAHFYRRGLELIAEKPSRLLRTARNLPEGAGIGQQGYWPGPDKDRFTSRYRRFFFYACLLPSALGVVSLALRRRWAARENAPLLVSAGLVLSSLITVLLFLGDPRMRVPFDPLSMLLAAAGYVWLGDALAARRAGPKTAADAAPSA
jgi:4-amino-4-deoxy-L-arabinose transferase-like glycosyltransferase